VQVRLYDMLFLGIFYEFFISGPQHQSLVKCLTKSIFPADGEGELTTSVEAIKRRPEPVHLE